MDATRVASASIKTLIPGFCAARKGRGQGMHLPRRRVGLHPLPLGRKVLADFRL